MITIKMKYGDKEFNLLTDITLNTPIYKEKQKKNNIFFLTCAIILLACGIFFIFKANVNWVIFAFAFAALCIFMFFFGNRLLLRTRVFAQTKKVNLELYDGDRFFTFDEEGLTIKTTKESNKYTYSHFIDYGFKDNYLWIERDDFKYIVCDLTKLNPNENETIKNYCLQIKKVNN